VVDFSHLSMTFDVCINCFVITTKLGRAGRTASTMEIQMSSQAMANSEHKPELRDMEKIQKEPPMVVEEDILPEWNNPRINIYRVFATFYSFFIFGMNDGAYGVS